MSSFQTTSAFSETVQLFIGHRTVVLFVAKTFGIERNQLAAIGHIVKPVAFDQRRRGDALKRPIVHAARRQLFVGVLPEELSVGFVESHEYAAIARLLGIE